MSVAEAVRHRLRPGKLFINSRIERKKSSGRFPEILLRNKEDLSVLESKENGKTVRCGERDAEGGKGRGFFVKPAIFSAVWIAL